MKPNDFCCFRCVIERWALTVTKLLRFFCINNNYNPILYHFRYEARFCSKIRIFHTPAFDAPLRGGFRGNIAITFGAEKTRIVWLPNGEKF